MMDYAALTWQAWFTLAAVVSMFLVLIFTKLRTDVAFLCMIIALYVSGVLDVKGAFGGFCSNSVLVVAAMYCVIAGLTHTGVLKWVVTHLMGHPKSLNSAIVRVMVPVAALSSILSNTTVVALFVNVVKMWSRKLGISPSKLLIPLSYASGMGGICTILGTPPNLIIAGMYAQDTGVQMGVFITLLPGLFCLTVGILSMIAMKKLIPDRKSPMDSSGDSDYTLELSVPSNNIHVGQELSAALESAGIEKNEVDVIALRRYDNMVICPIDYSQPVMGSDRVLVSGQGGQIKKFSHKMGFVNEFLDDVVESDIDEDQNSWKTALSSLILISAITLSAMNVLPLLQACLLAAVAMLVFRCCTPSQSMKSIDWSILIVFAGSAAIGLAIEKTGLAQALATSILNICGTNPYVVLTCICLVGTFITEFISNTAAGAMFYPIAMSSATTLGVSPLPFCIALMIAVSSSFATPIGSPTHMLVYLPGGYKFSDFARTGILMNLIILAANIFISTLLFPF